MKRTPLPGSGVFVCPIGRYQLRSGLASVPINQDILTDWLAFRCEKGQELWVCLSARLTFDGTPPTSESAER